MIPGSSGNLKLSVARLVWISSITFVTGSLYLSIRVLDAKKGGCFSFLYFTFTVLYFSLLYFTFLCRLSSVFMLLFCKRNFFTPGFMPYFLKKRLLTSCHPAARLYCRMVPSKILAPR